MSKCCQCGITFSFISVTIILFYIFNSEALQESKELMKEYEKSKNKTNNITEEEDNNNNKTINDPKGYILIDKEKFTIKYNLIDKGCTARFDGYNAFGRWMTNNNITICEGKDSYHKCNRNSIGYPCNSNGMICEMKNVILDPSNWRDNKHSFVSPMAPRSYNEKQLLSGLFNMQCDINNIHQPEDYFKEYVDYFDSWNYTSNDSFENEELVELAPDKTVLFVQRYIDLLNFYHEHCHIFHAYSMIGVLGLKREQIQVVFLDNYTNVDYKYMNIWEKVISDSPVIYTNDLQKSGKKYHISSAYKVPIAWDSPFAPCSDSPSCSNHIPSPMFEMYRRESFKYMDIPVFKDSLDWDKDIIRYPSNVKNPQSSNYKKFITIQWRQVWPKNRKGQQRILANGPELMEALSKIVRENTLIRLVDTAKFDIEGQISVINRTDFFIGIHGAGLTLAVYAPKHTIFQEIYHSPNVDWLRFLAVVSGHRSFKDHIRNRVEHDGNEQVHFDIDDFVNLIKRRINEVDFYNIKREDF